MEAIALTCRMIFDCSATKRMAVECRKRHRHDEQPMGNATYGRMRV